MDDLISRKALKACVYYDKQMCEIIEEQPTIDPVKHGKIIESEETNSGGLIRMVCSECGKVIYRTYGCRLADVRYCPYCGARMDGE